LKGVAANKNRLIPRGDAGEPGSPVHQASRYPK
jgi:hypothetical protein